MYKYKKAKKDRLLLGPPSLRRLKAKKGTAVVALPAMTPGLVDRSGKLSLLGGRQGDSFIKYEGGSNDE